MSDHSEIDNAIASGATYGEPAVQDALFKNLRQEDPVHWTTPTGFRPFWTVSRHADIVEIERQNELFLNEPRTKLFNIDFEQKVRALKGERGDVVRGLPQMDNPDHRTYRQLTQAWFLPKQVKQLEERIAVLADRSMQELRRLAPNLDFYKDIAAWYPLRVIMLILGLSELDEVKLQKITAAYFGGDDDEMLSGSDQLKAAQDFVDYFDGVSQDRRKNPKDDVATIIANAMIDGKPIGHREASSYYIALASAGHDTTSATAAAGILAMIERPDQWRKLQENPELVASAVDEMVRWASPVKHFFRTAKQDYVLRGKHIKAGDHLMMCYPSGNRDEEVFGDPYEFRVDRNPNKHVGFGFGAHACLGMFLAKTELQILFRTLLQNVDRFELNGEPAWVRTTFVGGIKQLPVRVHLKA